MRDSDAHHSEDVAGGRERAHNEAVVVVDSLLVRVTTAR
jgi:hypothetical protein